MAERDFRPIYPPWTPTVIPPRNIPRYKGYIAQYKYNDIRTVAYLLPTRKIELYTRHLVHPKSYKLTPALHQAFRSLDLSPDKLHALDGGIIRHLKRGREQFFVIWDILIHDGRYLEGTTFRDRYALLNKIAGGPKTFESVTGHRLGLKIRGPLWLAPIFTRDLEAHYLEHIELGQIEGLMLKKPSGRLERPYSSESNSSWQLKVRKPHANYPY